MTYKYKHEKLKLKHPHEILKEASLVELPLMIKLKENRDLFVSTNLLSFSLSKAYDEQATRHRYRIHL